LFRRRNNLSFSHHQEVAGIESPEDRQWWLDRALEGDGKKRWSSNKLRAAINQGKAFDRTRKVELEAEALGKFVVLYADPPWQYASNDPYYHGHTRDRYPTLSIAELKALPVLKRVDALEQDEDVQHVFHNLG